jgi:hypothetical protein
VWRTWQIVFYDINTVDMERRGVTYAIQSVYVLALGPPEVDIVNGYINLSGSFPSVLLISSLLKIDIRNAIRFPASCETIVPSLRLTLGSDDM